MGFRAWRRAAIPLIVACWDVVCAPEMWFITLNWNFTSIKNECDGCHELKHRLLTSERDRQHNDFFTDRITRPLYAPHLLGLVAQYAPSYSFRLFRCEVCNLLVTSRHNKPLNHDIICFVSYLITKLLQSRTSSVHWWVMAVFNGRFGGWFVLPNTTAARTSHSNANNKRKRFHGNQMIQYRCWWMVAKNTFNLNVQQYNTGRDDYTAAMDSIGLIACKAHSIAVGWQPK